MTLLDRADRAEYYWQGFLDAVSYVLYGLGTALAIIVTVVVVLVWLDLRRFRKSRRTPTVGR